MKRFGLFIFSSIMNCYLTGQMVGTNFDQPVFFYKHNNDAERLGFKGKIKSVKIVADERNAHPGYISYKFDENQNLIEEISDYQFASYEKTNYYYGVDNILDSSINYYSPRDRFQNFYSQNDSKDTSYIISTYVYSRSNNTLLTDIRTIDHLKNRDTLFGPYPVYSTSKNIQILNSQDFPIQEIGIDAKGDTTWECHYQYIFKPHQHKIIYTETRNPKSTRRQEKIYTIYYDKTNRYVKKQKQRWDGVDISCNYFIRDNYNNVIKVYDFWCKRNSYRWNELKQSLTYSYDLITGNPTELVHKYEYTWYSTYNIIYW